MLNEIERPSLKASRDRSSLLLFHMINCDAVSIGKYRNALFINGRVLAVIMLLLFINGLSLLPSRARARVCVCVCVCEGIISWNGFDALPSLAIILLRTTELIALSVMWLSMPCVSSSSCRGLV